MTPTIPDKEDKKDKYWEVIQLVEMKFQIVAPTKEAAKLLIQDPHTITVKKETIKLAKYGK